MDSFDQQGFDHNPMSNVSCYVSDKPAQAKKRAGQFATEK